LLKQIQQQILQAMMLQQKLQFWQVLPFTQELHQVMFTAKALVRLAPEMWQWQEIWDV